MEYDIEKILYTFEDDYNPSSMAQEPRNMYAGGQLVQPNADGSRPGYAGDPVESNIRSSPTGNAYEVNIQRGPQIFNKTFRKDKYKNATEALNAARKFRDQKKKIPFKTGIQEPKYGSGLSQKEYMKIYNEATRDLTESGKLAEERNLKLKNFIGKKKKIKASVLKNFILDDIGYENYDATKIKKKFPDLVIEKDIKTGSEYKPLTKEQIITVKDNFDLPEGEKWDFKKYKNGLNGEKYPNLVNQIRSRVADPKKYKIAANFSDPQGWMMMSMNRVYENEKKNKVKPKDRTYQPKFNNRGMIVGFTDNTATGQSRTFYGLKKNMRDDGTEWRAHGDFDRVGKFINIANGAKEQPSKLLTKILNDKGITNLMGETSTLKLNDILSHERFYNKLSETKPSELIKRQIVLHHGGGVGAGTDVARAAATKDIQLLTAANNSRANALEQIVRGSKKNPARKLNADEILELKNMGAKITDFGGKTVGGGYTDPTKQFAAIEKKALEYAKGDKFNVKTVANYLERLGCGGKFGGGGRINFAKGVPELSPCAKKGITKVENGLKNGFKNADDMSLAKNILKSGKFFKDAVSLRGLFGPAALGFTALAEAGLVSYDMLSKGKSFREAVGDSLFNYVVKGTDYEIDSDEEFMKRLKSTGNMNDQQIGQMLNFKSVIDDMNRGFNLNTKLENVDQAILDNKASQDGTQMFPDNAFNLDAERDALRADIQDYNRTGTPRRVTDYILSDKAQEGANAAALANLYVEQDQLQNAGIGNIYQSKLGDEKRVQRGKEIGYEIENLLNPTKYNDFAKYFMSRPKQEQSMIMSYKEGGIASLNVKK